MKKLKVFIILAGILLAGILMMSSKIYAVDSSANPMYLGLYNNSNARKTGFYDYLDASKARRPAIKIVKYENAQGLGNVDYLTQIYCLRHGIGFGSEGSTAAIVPYTQHFDMKQPETIGNEYKEAIGITAGVTPNYNKIMWILNMVANPNNQESIIALFEAAGINIDDFKGDKAQMTQEEMIDIIEAAQQMAIWYYTNPTGDYHPSGTNESLRVGLTNQNNSKSPVVSKYYNDEINYPLNELYRYLITKSEEAVNRGYTYQTAATTINFNKDNATYVEEGANYKFGPYNLTYTNNPGINVNIEADVQLGNNIRIVNAQGVEYPGNTVSEKILNANGTDFYAVVPKSTNVKTFKIAVSANYQTTDITYWSTSANIAQRNQPVVIVQKAPKAFNDEKIIQVREIPKEFDLALRKFITGIRSATGVAKQVESREPVITQQALEDLATGRTEFKTTAVKTHRKDALTVETGDIVTYTIRVYNEGDVDGYVDQITDYLPAGLELTENSRINQANRWAKDGKVLRSELHTKDLLKAFDKNTKTLSYVDYQVECTVLDTTNLTTRDLTNVAEITAQRPVDNQQIRDRDSVPNNLTRDQITNYNPGTSEKGKGYEDDDDYEPLKTSNKEFDLALRKFITGIRTSTGVAKQIGSREPVITKQALEDLATGRTEFKTTAVKTHTKNPLQVEKGDIVTYTIRVYNEGEVDGYVREIADYLPAGLELTENSRINQANGWNKDGKTLKSQFHAKNIIKAFDKNTKTLSYVDFQAECTVLDTTNLTTRDLTNVSEITSQDPKEGVNVRDRDSIPSNLRKEQISNYNPGTSERGKGYEDDDDYEPLKPVEKEFDLALRKFITSVNGTEVTSRIPDVDVTPLVNKTDTTAIYRHSKEPVKIKISDIVTYTIRVYNEGDIDGYADEIVDHLPEYLEYIDNDFNKQYGWQLDPSDNTGRTIKTNYLSDRTNKANIIKKFDGKTLDYKELKIQTRIKSGVKPTKYLTDIAEITESHNEFKIPDRDNYKKVVLPKTSDEFSEYKGHNSNKKDLSDKRYYYKGQEDDDDFEKVVVEGEFDLALRKFITQVNEEAVTNRIPQVDTSKFGTIGADGKPVTTMTYNHTKEPILVNTTDIVTYTIRVYNEGEVNGYATEVKDDLPEGLEFLPDNATNKEYRWQLLDKDGKVTTNVKEAVSIITDYLSKEQEKTSGSNLLKAYDKTTMKTPDYKDVKIAFRVTEPQTSDRILINKAQISKHHDEFGKEVKDRDSTPNKWNEGEDDQDIEKVRVRYFDLSLRKWVTQVIVIEDGKQKVKDTGHYAEQDPEPVVKVEVNKKRLKNTVVKFRYSIRVKNEGEIEGYAKEISDYIPSGLKFNKADNPDWVEKDGKIVTTKLKDTLLKPGETAEVTVLLTWINGEENMKVMTNNAEISEDYNKYKTPDRDSKPNNKKKGEDDQDDAPVTVTTVSGSTPVYIGIAVTGIAIIAIGGILVKRYI
ncbi:MAG: DUF11 domain-containing protein [Clostridiales bacterium]|nr:DUF11 domain-containing protein [Clostridiales bacterium]